MISSGLTFAATTLWKQVFLEGGGGFIFLVFEKVQCVELAGLELPYVDEVGLKLAELPLQCQG